MHALEKATVQLENYEELQIDGNWILIRERTN